MRPYIARLSTSWLLFGIVLPAAVLVAGCAGHSRLHSDSIPPGSLRLAQVMEIAKGADIMGDQELRKAVVAAGIGEDKIVDGSIVAARIYCCGGMSAKSSPEVVNSRILYVPKGIPLAVGDLVEVKVGREAANGDGGELNTVQRLVEPYGAPDPHCWWDPRDDRLWMRVLRCDWMEKDGWIKQGGINPTWYKPASPRP